MIREPKTLTEANAMLRTVLFAIDELVDDQAKTMTDPAIFRGVMQNAKDLIDDALAASLDGAKLIQTERKAA